jgi:hypothetical protein
MRKAPLAIVPRPEKLKLGFAYLIAGGAPAGIKMPTPDLGCLTNSTKINTTTMQGNNRTTPRGIEMLELPFNRSGRRKNANLEVTFVFVLTSSIEGRSGDAGMRFSTLCTNPIDTVACVVCWGKGR